MRKKTQSASEPLHCHEFIELVYVLSGSATQRVDDCYYEVARGDIIFINYNSRHAFEPHEEFSYVDISFLPDVLASSVITRENASALLSLTAFDDMRKDQNGGKLTFRGEDRQEAEFIISVMLREYEGTLPQANHVMENYLSILLTKMLRMTLMVDTQDQGQDLFGELASYIEENLGSELTLSALAGKCFYNPSYFSRMFKQHFGTSLSDYVRGRRMEYALTLLADTSLSVNDIIDRVGYTDRSAFYHVFSKYTGMTPADYRMKHK